MHIGKPASQKAKFKIAVDATGRTEHGPRRQSADVCTAISQIGVVGHCKHDFVGAEPQHAIRHMQLERGGEPGMEADELSIRPCIDLIAHTLERQHCWASLSEIHDTPVEERSANVRQRHVIGMAGDRKCLPRVQRIDSERVADSRRAKCIHHVFPVSRHGVLHHHSPELRNVNRFPCIREIGHFPRAIKRNSFVEKVFVRRGRRHKSRCHAMGCCKSRSDMLPVHGSTSITYICRDPSWTELKPSCRPSGRHRGCRSQRQ